MKKTKKLLVLLLVLTMLIGVTSLSSSAQKTNVTTETEAEEDFTAEDYVDLFREFIKPDTSEEDIAKLTAQLEKAFELESELDNLWIEIENSDVIDWELLEEAWEEWEEEYTFEMLKEEFKEGLSEEVLAKAEELFNQAMLLEEQENYEAADKVWVELFNLGIFDECEWELY